MIRAPAQPGLPRAPAGRARPDRLACSAVSLGISMTCPGPILARLSNAWLLRRRQTLARLPDGMLYLDFFCNSFSLNALRRSSQPNHLVEITDCSRRSR